MLKQLAEETRFVWPARRPGRAWCAQASRPKGEVCGGLPGAGADLAAVPCLPGQLQEEPLGVTALHQGRALCNEGLKEFSVGAGAIWEGYTEEGAFEP